MTQYQLSQPPPSWVRPIALGAGFAMFAQFLPVAFSAIVPEGSIALPCCCALETIPMGLLPAWLAKRQDPAVTAGQGFVVSFIAVGLASVIVALVMVLQLRGVDTDALRAEAIERMQPSPMSPEEKQKMADMLVSVMPYIPVLGACVITLLGGFWGLFGVSLAGRGQSTPPPPPPPPPAAM